MVDVLRAFLCGMREFRLNITTSYMDHGLDMAYELGREVAHLLTLRRFS